MSARFLGGGMTARRAASRGESCRPGTEVARAEPRHGCPRLFVSLSLAFRPQSEPEKSCPLSYTIAVVPTVPLSPISPSMSAQQRCCQVMRPGLSSARRSS